ncbi:MAG: hypothetical protein NC313_04545 [Butyrivibrio sp.]|nr:hypothetical protein [Butyrivibrio sp.]
MLGAALSKVKNLILRNMEFWWLKINPVIFVHSSDLMLPSDKGTTIIQMIVISRLMDIENRRQGGVHYYWQARLCELDYKKQYTEDEKREMDENFERFFQAMEMRGFNPDISWILIAQQPIMAQSDGTHRLGYLLSDRSNVFVPAKVRFPMSWGYPIDGITWLSDIGMPQKEIEKILERYQMLYHDMRRYIIAVIDKEIFEQNSKALLQEIKCIGECKGIRCLYKKNGIFRMPKQKRKYCKGKEQLVIFEIEIQYQHLYYKHGKLKSKLADMLTDRWQKLVGTDGYVAGTITESITLETYLDENYFEDKEWKKF